MTLRENAQFIDELRQHYRRLDGLLVVYGPSLPGVATWEFTEPMIALRKLLFGGVGDPNLASSTQPYFTPRGETVATAASRHGGAVPLSVGIAGSTPAGATPMQFATDASKTPSNPPSPEEIEEKGKLRAPTGASPVKLEVVR